MRFARHLFVIVVSAALLAAGSHALAAVCGHEHAAAINVDHGCAGEVHGATACACTVETVVTIVPSGPDMAKAIIFEDVTAPSVGVHIAKLATPVRDPVPRSGSLWLLTARLRL